MANSDEIDELKDWTITQSIYSCEGTLNQISAPKISLTYSDVVPNEIITPELSDSSSFIPFEISASIWDRLFDNTDSLNCPINDCQIYQAGSCGSEIF